MNLIRIALLGVILILGPINKAFADSQSDHVGQKNRLDYCEFGPPPIQALEKFLQADITWWLYPLASYCFADWVKTGMITPQESVDAGNWLLDRTKDRPDVLNAVMIQLAWSNDFVPRSVSAPLLDRIKAQVENVHPELQKNLENTEKAMASHGFPIQYVSTDPLFRKGARPMYLRITRPVLIPGVLPIASTYSNTGRSAKSVTEVGTGNIVEIPGISSDSQFVLTAAHVLEGSHPVIWVNGRPVAIDRKRQALVDNDNDLALIEIPKTSGPPVAIYSAERRELKMSQEFRNQWEKQNVPEAQLAVVSHFGEESFKILMLPVSLWAKEGIEPDEGPFESESPERKKVISQSQDGMQIKILQGKATEGTSGSLVYDLHADDFPIQGVVTESNYYFRETRLASSKAITQLIEEFRKGRRGTLSTTRWAMKNGTLYRTFPDDLVETSFVDTPRGNGVYSSPGNGVYSSPGNGVYSHPGKDSYLASLTALCAASKGQPLSQEDLASFYSLLGRMSGPEDELGTHPTPEKIFEHYGIKPGILWHGNPVLGIRATPVHPGVEQPLVLYGDGDAIRFMNENKSKYRFSPIAQNQTMRELLLEKLGVPKSKWNSSSNEPIRLTAKFGAPNVTYEGDKPEDQGTTEIEIYRDRIEIRARAITDFNPLTRQYMRDDVKVVLDPNGVPKGSHSFLPVITVPATGDSESYNLDLRPLFFSEPDAGNAPPRVTLNNTRSGIEIQYEFSASH